MGFSNLVALAIMTTAAATLHLQGITDITSAAQAADALKPIAGQFAFALFAFGFIGTGFLSVPVLAGSAAYALGEARRWPVGLARPTQHAKAFYTSIAAATLIGAGANALNISSVKALIWSSILNAIVAVPVMALIMRIATNAKIMGQFKVTGAFTIIGWLATGIMALASFGENQKFYATCRIWTACTIAIRAPSTIKSLGRVLTIVKGFARCRRAVPCRTSASKYCFVMSQCSVEEGF